MALDAPASPDHPYLTGTSTVEIVDARDLGAGSVASVVLPRRVPLGFHGSWLPAAG